MKIRKLRINFFIIFATGVNVIKLFTAVIYEFTNFRNKLECLSLTNLPNLVYIFARKADAYLIEAK